MAHRINSRERNDNQIRALFEKHIVQTGTRIRDIHNVTIVEGKEDNENTVEEQLVLYDKKVTENDIKFLKKFIRSEHPYLTKLHINNNRIGVGGAEILATLIKDDSSMLQELFLNRNYLYDAGVIALAKALKTNSRIKQLKIGYNLAKDEAASAVADMISKNSTLRGLEFDGNKYTVTGLSSLADAMNKNQGLKVVQVGEAHNIKSRLQFVRMMIQTENAKKPRTDAVLCFSKDKNNEIIDMLLEEWRICRKEGKDLIQIPREKSEKFRKFNRLSEEDFEELKEDVKIFLKEARERGVDNLRQAKIILMGRAGAGKTSLVRSLVAGRSLLTGEGPNRATASVEINKWTVDGAKCTFWDFGGQEEYYLTHTFFVTPRCVVLICLNLEEYDISSEEEARKAFHHYVQYFIDSIQSHAPGAKFVIVGTHADTISRTQQAEIKKSLQELFEDIEQENFNRLKKEIEKLDTSENDEERDLISTPRSRPKKAQQPIAMSLSKGAGSTLDEIHVGQKPRPKLQAIDEVEGADTRRLITKNTLKNSSKNDLFGKPGMTIADDFEVRVEKPQSPSQRPKARAGKLNRSGKTFGTGLGTKNPVDMKEKLRLERLEKLQTRRDNRPKLIDVCVTSSSVDVQGIKEFKDILQESLVENHSELEISVELPSNYASLYEIITGDKIILTNSKIKNYNIKEHREGKSKNILNLGGRKKSVRGKKGPSLARMFTTDDGDKQKSPIIEISKLYDEFITSSTTFKSSKVFTRTTRKRKKQKKLFSKVGDLHKALKILHEIGYILWYKDNEVLRDIVFVDPHWVVSMIKSVIRHNMFEKGEGSLNSIEKPDNMTFEEFDEAKEIFQKKAVLDSRLLFCFNIWKDATKLQRFNMLSLMHSFDLICEEARNTAKDPIPKYFIPAYLKSVFLEGEAQEVAKRLKELEESVLKNVSTVPKFVRGLFFKQDLNNSSNASLLKQQMSSKRTFFEKEGGIRPKNIQWRYEFKNFLPEGLFLRLLVRCHPFISFYEAYRPTESFLVGKAALGVTIFIQVERNKYGLAGALVITAIQELVVESASFQYNMSDIWQVFSLFAFETEDLLQSFPGLETHVLVNIVQSGVGKVSLPRRELETQELLYNSNPKKQYKNITISVGPENVPMHFLVPPLFVLPRQPHLKPNATFTSPELVRLSKIARIEYGLLSTEAQIGEEAAGKRSRIQILHKQLVKYVDLLLKQLCAKLQAAEKPLLLSFEESLVFLKENKIMKISEMENQIIRMREMEQSSFIHQNNRITVGHLRDAIRVSWDLFRLLEDMLTTNKK